MTGECVQTGHQEQRGGGHSGASQKENGAGSSGHPENGHHGPDRAQPGHSFQVSLTITLSVSELYSPTAMMYRTQPLLHKILLKFVRAFSVCMCITYSKCTVQFLF